MMNFYERLKSMICIKNISRCLFYIGGYRALASFYLNLQNKESEFFASCADAPAAGAGLPPMKCRGTTATVLIILKKQKLRYIVYIINILYNIFNHIILIKDISFVHSFYKTYFLVLSHKAESSKIWLPVFPFVSPYINFFSFVKQFVRKKLA